MSRGAGGSGAGVRIRWWQAAALVAVALAVRAAVAPLAIREGVMEGLAIRYERDAYALAAGYGLERPVETGPIRVDLVRVADSLAARGERLTPANAPARDPAQWRPSSLHPPGYAYFLLGIYRTLGPPVIPWARVLQALLDALACLLVFDIGRRVIDARVGLFAAFAVALFPPLAYHVTSRVADSLMPFLVTLSFWIFVRGVESRRLVWFAACGAALGLTTLVRPDYLLLPPFLVVVAAGVWRAWRPALAGGALLAAALLVVLLPWGLRNLAVYGEFKLTTSAAGMTLYQSIGQFPNPYGISYRDEWMLQTSHEAGFESFDDPDADRHFRRRFLEIAREDPGLLVSQAIKRIPLGVMPLYKWGYRNPAYQDHSFYDYLDEHGLDAYEALRRHPVQLFQAYWDRLIFGMISLALFLSWLALLWVERSHRWTVVLVGLPYLYTFASHLLILMQERLMVPAVFSLFLALGYLGFRLFGREQGGPWPQATWKVARGSEGRGV